MIKSIKYGLFGAIYLFSPSVSAGNNPFFKTLSEIEHEQNVFLSQLKLEADKQQEYKRVRTERLELEREKKEKVRAYIQRRIAEYDAYERYEAKQKKVIPNKVLVGHQSLKVTATAYTSHPDECSTNPFLGAWDNRLVPGSKSIAVSRDLLKKYGFSNGTKVRISGLPGIYCVRDTMHARYTNRIDIYMGMDKNRALHWGEKNVVIYWD